ncbi:MAG: DUF2867 domain-containing protein [Acidimicrobiia bacterium]|nr:DUF2867 domain-containing protein [Acidimicrobiia bacterium]
MVTPKWVTKTRCQPIAISDVIERLLAVCGRPDLHGVWEVGGSDVVTYLEMMQAYAAAAGLRPRLVIPLPLLTPRLSARWVHFVTALPKSIAGELVESLQNDVIVGDRDLHDVMPLPRTSLDDALSAALAAVKDLDIPTRWTPRVDARMARPQAWDPEWAGGTVFTDERSIEVRVDPDVVIEHVRRVGGEDRWFGFAPLRSLRALIDELIGGPGWRRGRRHRTELSVGDVVDVFSVEVSTDDHLRLRADMLMPGWGWLEWTVQPTATGTRLNQCARFVPRGLLGSRLLGVPRPVPRRDLRAHGEANRRSSRGLRHVIRRSDRADERPILVTGATGFIGLEVVRRLAELGRPVRAVFRRHHRAALLARIEADLVMADLASADSLRRAVDGCGAVIHCAGRATFESYDRLRPTLVDGTKSLADEAVRAGVERFVFASSLSEERCRSGCPTCTGALAVGDDLTVDWRTFLSVLKTYAPTTRIIEIPHRISLPAAGIAGRLLGRGRHANMLTGDTIRGWNLDLAVEPGSLGALGLHCRYPSVYEGFPAVLDSAFPYRWHHPVADRRGL